MQQLREQWASLGWDGLGRVVSGWMGPGQVGSRSGRVDSGNTQQSNSTRERGEEDGTNGRPNEQTNE